MYNWSPERRYNDLVCRHTTIFLSSRAVRYYNGIGRHGCAGGRLTIERVKMKVIVFGGTGWVGHNIAIDCNNAGYEVVVCSRGKTDEFKADLVENIRTIQADKQNEQQMAEIFEQVYDVVIDSVPDDGKAIEHVVKYARGLKHYIHCSSVMSYTPLPFIPGDETMPFSEYMGYGRGKNIVDCRVMDLCKKDKLPATVIRPSYVTGPGKVPIDNLGGRREDFIADILEGKTLDLPNDGGALLHPVHVKDVSYSFVLAIKHSESIGQVYNICGAKAVTIKNYLKITAAALDRKANINCVPLQEMVEKYKDTADEAGLRFFAEHMCYDITKARTQLEYTPKYNITEAIEENARWAAEQYR